MVDITNQDEVGAAVLKHIMDYSVVAHLIRAEDDCKKIRAYINGLIISEKQIRTRCAVFTDKVSSFEDEMTRVSAALINKNIQKSLKPIRRAIETSESKLKQIETYMQKELTEPRIKKSFLRAKKSQREIASLLNEKLALMVDSVGGESVLLEVFKTYPALAKSLDITDSFNSEALRQRLYRLKRKKPKRS